MKNIKYSSLIVLLLIIGFLAIFVAGCISPTQVAPAVPAQPAITNAATGVITPAVAAIPAQVVYAPSPKLASISSNEAAIYNQAAPVIGLVYPPAAPILTGVQSLVGAIFAGITGISVIWARKKNGEAVVSKQNADTAQGVAKTIIQGVEAAGPAAAAIKQLIAKNAIANGNADHVENAVNAVTGSA